MELRHTIKLIQILDDEITEIEERIQNHMQEIHSPIYSRNKLSSCRSHWKSETSNGFLRRTKFWLSQACHQRLINPASTLRKMPLWKSVVPDICVTLCFWLLISRYSKIFAAYLKKKRDEGKHYFVALSHVAKKLVRVIFHLQRTRESFSDFA